MQLASGPLLAHVTIEGSHLFCRLNLTALEESGLAVLSQQLIAAASSGTPLAHALSRGSAQVSNPPFYCTHVAQQQLL